MARLYPPELPSEAVVGRSAGLIPTGTVFVIGSANFFAPALGGGPGLPGHSGESRIVRRRLVAPQILGKDYPT